MLVGEGLEWCCGAGFGLYIFSFVSSECLCVRVPVCVYVCVYVCVRACVRVCKGQYFAL